MDGAAIIVPTVPASAWASAALPGTSVAALPVAGRLFIDYALDGARLFGITMVQLQDWSYSEELAGRFVEPRDGYTTVFYQKGEGQPPRGLAEIGGVSGPFTEYLTDGTVCDWGLCLPMHAPGESRLEPLSEAETKETPPGIYRYAEGRWMRVLPEGFVVRDTASWLGLSLALLRGEGHYALPGYSAEKGISLCRNVVLELGTEVAPPALFLDDCRCARNVRIDGGVSIGRDSFVGEGTRLKNTMVCDETMVGEGLELEDKIIVGRRVIDAPTGTWVDIDEPGVVRRVRYAPGWLRAIGNFLAGTSRGRRM